MYDTSVIPGTRVWGDGLRTRDREHLIEDIHYGADGFSWLVCSDGWRGDGETPEALASKWKAHGGQVLETDFLQYVEPGPPLAGGLVQFALMLAERCECDGDYITLIGDIRDCPNYLPGDEEYYE